LARADLPPGCAHFVDPVQSPESHRRPAAGRSTALSVIRVLDFFGFPWHGGSVSALCAWQIGPELAKAAGGDPIHLASHVRDASSAEMLIADGPRSQPVASSETECSIVVPLAVPAAAGVYDVEVDGLAEGKCWEAALGNSPLILRVERLSDGGLVWRDESAGRRYHLEGPAAEPRRPFRIPHRLYGAAESERSVEIPWVLSRYRGEPRVLDVGYASAEPRYLDALTALRVPLLVGIDLAASPRAGIRPIVADVRAPALRPASFDLVLAISVIEHVGRDNTRYIGERSDAADPEGDLVAIRALSSLLTPGGRLLLTVPFGVEEDHGWFLQYDARRLDRLIAASGLALAEAEFHRYDGGWSGPVPPRELAGCRYAVGAVAASGLACIALKRTRILPASLGGRANRWRSGLREAVKRSP